MQNKPSRLTERRLGDGLPRVGGLLLALCLAVLSAPGAAWADPHPPPPSIVLGPVGERELTVLNRGQRPIGELYASPTDADDWGADRLGDVLLERGKSLRMMLGRTRVCSFDIAVVFDNGAREEIRDVNLCRTRQVVFDGSRAVVPVAPAGQLHTITLLNGSAKPIQMLFLSAPDAAQWGDDLLGDAALSARESRQLTYTGGCRVDVRVVFSNRAAEERRAIDLCTSPDLRIEPGWTTVFRLGDPD